MPSVNNVLSYLDWKFNESHMSSPRSLLKIRSALKWSVNASYIPVVENILVSRFLTGLFNLHPVPPRPQREIWDVNEVLAYWDSQPENKDLPLMFLSQKVLLLVLISTMKRRSEVMGMRVDNFYFEPNSMVFPLLIYPKTYTIASKTDAIRYITIRKFVDNPNICPLLAVQHYIYRTLALRTTQSLFIITQSPFRAAASMTLRRWILTGLDQAGIDISKYSATSTHHASSSKAFFVGVSVDDVMKRAGWHNVSSFVSHYNLPISGSGQSVKHGQEILPRWQRNFSFGTNMKNARNVVAHAVLQKARANVYRNAVKFQSSPFVAAPSPVPRLSLTKPITAVMSKSALQGKHVSSARKAFPVSSVPITVISQSSQLSTALDGSSTESASDHD